MSKALHGLLSQADKGVHEAESELALMFRCILAELNINASQWDRGMKRFLENRYGPSESKADKRSNQNRALSNPKMSTWDTFLNGLEVLNPKQVNFSTTLYWRDDVQLPNTPPDELSLDMRGQENELCTFFRMLIRDIGLRSNSYELLVERWISRLGPEISSNPTARSTVKNNMRKALFDRNSFTWSTFSRGLAILGVKEFEFTIVMWWPKGKFTRHCFQFETTNTFDVKGSKSDE